MSRAPMYVMRGEFPTKAIAHYMPKSFWWLKIGLHLGAWAVCPTETFRHLFFLEDALKFKAAMCSKTVSLFSRWDAPYSKTLIS